MWSDQLPERIPGLSARTSLEIFRAERRSPVWEVHGGSTKMALARYRAFVAASRPVYLMSIDYSCPGCCLDDVRHARAALDGVLVELPPRARAEFGQLLRALDKRYLQCTLPDPFPIWHSWRAEGWWFRRLTS
ncbi:hypothetical protein [Kibdelosporangium aridum]|uniref:hypothetical protein n=1 Tax=Kibdelosporangium aridum TaxID=2030 RepID=UPI000ABF2D29|nr:hypothetical protein [Kibdelosporangium aridum]